MSDGIFQFDATDHVKIKGTQISDLKGMGYEQDLPQVVDSLIDLLHGKQKEKLDKRGYVVALNGLWGSGKTTATWAVINEIKKTLAANNNEEKIEVVAKEFLLFGNASESIASFLREFAHKLWTAGFVDVRDDIEQFILEVTPANDSNYMVTAGAGPLSISRPIKLKAKDITYDVIKTKFLKLAGSHKVVVLVLDDLDRLKPEEIVQLMRMVEKLRKIPRIIIILPVYQAIITEAFKAELNLSPVAAPTFVRKLIDYSVNLTNGLSDLKTLFESHFTAEDVDAYREKLEGVSVGDMCWWILLHVLITHEAVDFIEQASDGNKAAQTAFSNNSSPYLNKLRYLIDRHNGDIRRLEAEIKILPTHFVDNNTELFRPWGQHYQFLMSGKPAEDALVQLREISNVDNVMMQICTDPDVEARVRSGEQITFEADKLEQNHTIALREVFINTLQQSGDEPYMTSKYKLREVDQLARLVRSKLNPNAEGDALANVYEAVKKSFIEFQDQRK